MDCVLQECAWRACAGAGDEVTCGVSASITRDAPRPAITCARLLQLYAPAPLDLPLFMEFEYSAIYPRIFILCVGTT